MGPIDDRTQQAHFLRFKPGGPAVSATERTWFQQLGTISLPSLDQQTSTVDYHAGPLGTEEWREVEAPRDLILGTFSLLRFHTRLTVDSPSGSRLLHHEAHDFVHVIGEER
jgi:hypothetical protein